MIRNTPSGLSRGKFYNGIGREKKNYSWGREYRFWDAKMYCQRE
jgi:hypothetical protein